MSWTATGTRHDRHMECVESGRRREDVAPVHWRVHQAGLHRWRPGLSTELQRPVRPDDIVRAAQEVDVPVELVGATGVAGRATAQVRRALANREVETLDERGVQGLGILRLPQRSLQPTRRVDPPAPFDSDDAIVPPSLEHVTIDARRPKEARNHPNVVLEPIGRDQRESGWPGRVSAKTRKRCTRDQEKRVAALKQRRDRAAAALAIDADLIAPRAALEHIAVKGDDGKDTLLPWQQQLLRGDA